MKTKPLLCKGCPWEGWSHGYIPPYGSGRNLIQLTSDYPEYEELQTEIPLSYGRAGDMMNRTLRRLKERRENYGINYLTHCRPPIATKAGGRPSLDDVSNWREATTFCKSHHPAVGGKKCIVALGSLALGELTSLPASDRTRGYVYKGSSYPVPVIGTYHPAMVGLGNTGLLFTLRYDLATALAKASPSFGTQEKNFQIDPPPEEFANFVQKLLSEAQWCVVDIETPFAGDDETEYSKKHLSYNIIRASFCGSNDPTRSVSVTWMPWYYESLKKLLGSNLDIVYWNGDYDDPRLAYNGFNRHGRFVDAMWLWHFLQPDLPKALAHVATYHTDLPEWKSKSEEDPGYYSCCDAYAEAQCYLAILKALEAKDMLSIADRHVTQLLGELRKVTVRGAQTDPSVLQKLREEVKVKLDQWDAKIKELCPNEAKKVKYYKGTPPGVKSGKVYVGLSKSIGGHSGQYFQDSTGRWGFRFDFNPDSPDQLKTYLRFRGIKIPKAYRTKRETTDDKALKRILAQTHDPLVAERLERAKAAKIYSTYTSWPLDTENRVHPKFGLAPATGRFNCTNPNFQNIPKEGEWASLVRRAITSSPGHVLVAADYVGMESFLTGYFANDPLYMKLSTMNIYAYVVAKNQGWELTEDNDEQLRRELSIYKKKAKGLLKKGESKTLYDKFKSIVLGIGYGEGKNTLFYGNPGLFKDLSEAGKLREFVFQTFPKIGEWQKSITKQASTGYLFNPWHYVRYFLDCPGSDSAKALAQLPQSTGAAMIKDVILALASTWVGEFLILQIHDELVYDVPEEREAEAVELIKSVMQQKWPQLSGHSIAVSVKRGYNLADLKEV